MVDYEFILGTKAERNKTKEINYLSLDLSQCDVARYEFQSFGNGLFVLSVRVRF